MQDDVGRVLREHPVVRLAVASACSAAISAAAARQAETRPVSTPSSTTGRMCCASHTHDPSLCRTCSREYTLDPEAMRARFADVRGSSSGRKKSSPRRPMSSSGSQPSTSGHSGRHPTHDPGGVGEGHEVRGVLRHQSVPRLRRDSARSASTCSVTSRIVTTK